MHMFTSLMTIVASSMQSQSSAFFSVLILATHTTSSSTSLRTESFDHEMLYSMNAVLRNVKRSTNFNSTHSIRLHLLKHRKNLWISLMIHVFKQNCESQKSQVEKQLY